MTPAEPRLRTVAAGAFLGAVLVHCAALDTDPHEWAGGLTPHSAVEALAGGPDRDAREVGLTLRRLLVYPDQATRAGTIGALEASLARLRSGWAAA